MFTNDAICIHRTCIAKRVTRSFATPALILLLLGFFTLLAISVAVDCLSDLQATARQIVTIVASNMPTPLVVTLALYIFGRNKD